MPYELANRQSDRYVSSLKGLFPDNSSLYKTDQKKSKTKQKQNNQKQNKKTSKNDRIIY